MDLLGNHIGHLALGIAGRILDAALWILPERPFDGQGRRMAGGPFRSRHPPVGPALPGFHDLVVRPLLGSMVVAQMRDGMVDERFPGCRGRHRDHRLLATEAMGLHCIIGAFVTGAVMPANLRRPILDRLQVLTVVLLMPFFFALTGPEP